jgi:hypothetical protein
MILYADKIQKRTIHDLILVGEHVWCLSGNREVYIWKWNPDATQKNVHDVSLIDSNTVLSRELDLGAAAHEISVIVYWH